MEPRRVHKFVHLRFIQEVRCRSPGSDAPGPVPVRKNVSLDTCHKSRAFKEAGAGLDMVQESRSNDNLWFGACSMGYKEASDCHWLAAPLATSTSNKPPEKIFSLYKVIFLNLLSSGFGNCFNLRSVY